MDLFVSAVKDTVKRFSLLKPGDSVLCSVSGGPDSVALLRVLNELSREWTLSLSALHVNHGLRGAESDADASFVGTLCRQLEVPLHVRSQRLKAGPGMNLQDLARRVRYRFLSETASAAGSVVATGHNLQDQGETLLLKLARGAGPTGLSGIFPAREIFPHGREESPVRMVRPLLERDRDEILGFLERRGQPYRDDSSNRNLRYDRNWVRHHLIPDLRSRLNPGPDSNPGTDRPALPGGGGVPGRRGAQGLPVVPGDAVQPLRRGQAEGRGASRSGAGPQEGGGPARGESLQGRSPGPGPGARRPGSGPGLRPKREADSPAGRSGGRTRIRPLETGKGGFRRSGSATGFRFPGRWPFRKRDGTWSAAGRRCPPEIRAGICFVFQGPA